MIPNLEILLFIGGGALAVLQWFLKNWVKNLETSIESIQKNQKDLDKEVQVIKETYVSKADMREMKDEIVKRLERIEGFLMGKRDV